MLDDYLFVSDTRSTPNLEMAASLNDLQRGRNSGGGRRPPTVNTEMLKFVPSDSMKSDGWLLALAINSLSLCESEYPLVVA